MHISLFGNWDDVFNLMLEKKKKMQTICLMYYYLIIYIHSLCFSMVLVSFHIIELLTFCFLTKSVIPNIFAYLTYAFFFNQKIKINTDIAKFYSMHDSWTMYSFVFVSHQLLECYTTSIRTICIYCLANNV